MKSDEMKPPPHLSAEAANWVSEICAEYTLDSHHFKILVMAAECLDRANQAREVVDSDGMTYTDRFGAPRPRPEVAIERNSRVAFARLVRELRLDLDGAPPGLEDF